MSRSRCHYCYTGSEIETRCKACKDKNCIECEWVCNKCKKRMKEGKDNEK